MSRYVAFLRGVSPQNLSMAALRQCLEATGYAEVRTVLSSGNVAFSTRTTSVAALERRVAADIAHGVGRSFGLTIRSVDELTRLVHADPFQAFAVPPTAKRVITFLHHPVEPSAPLPVERDGVHIFAAVEREVFTAYLPHPKGPVFMTMLERLFGKDITTRTLDTVKKCAAA
ncbi:MAG: DUF1697 domain-containing protein [Gemmatimonadaceae bacterium]|nr:DUF1697 domain-containing protein [Gemmatimonadaceae bacterium]